MSEQIIKELEKIDSAFKAVKTNYESNWQDTAKYFRPTKTDITQKKTDGDQQDVFTLFDSVSYVALNNFANILNGTLTNKATPWFDLKVEDEEIAEDDEVLKYLADTTKKIWNELYNSKSNFENAHQENLKDFGCFGNCAMKIEEGKSSIVNFSSLHIRTYNIGQNEEGKVDTVVISQEMTAQQIITKFQELGQISENIKKAGENEPNKKFEIKLYVMPRKDRDPTKIDSGNMPYVGYWVDVEAKKLIQEIGFNSFPIAVARGEKSSGEIWGTGLALLALPDARSLNRMWKDYFEATEKSLRPPLVVNAQFEKQLNLSPLFLNYTKSPVAYGRAVEPIVDTKGLQPTVELINGKQESIRKIFFLDKLVVLDDPRATATQILELRAESYRIMGSIATSLQEYLEDILSRVFDIMFRKSYAEDGNFTLLPNAILNELPNKLTGQIDEATGQKIFPRIKAEFINPITQAQRSNKNNSIDAFAMSVINLAQINPAILDTVNFDKMVNVKADILQIDPALIRNDAEVEQIRNERQQQQAQQQQLINANAEAQALKTANEAGL